MSSRPTIGLALVVKDVEAIIGDCLSSAAHAFDQVVVVDTGSTDGTKAAIRSVAPRAEILDFTPRTHPGSFLLDAPETWRCESVGLAGPVEMPGPFTGEMMLADFAAARQLGWDAITTDYAMWVDSDDVVEGAGNIQGVVESMARDGVDMAMLPYDYSTDAAGRVTSTLTRERIARKALGARWHLPVHEVLGPHALGRFYPDVKVVHRRWKLGLGYPVNFRNLKILVHWWSTRDVTKDDPRMLFYLARDARGVWPQESLRWFKEYCRRSGWDEERAAAHMHAGKIYEGTGDYENARSEYAQAAVEQAGKPDAFFALARVGYHKQDWGKCIEWSEKGFEVERNTAGGAAMMEYDPVARAADSYVYYGHALSRVGRHSEAVAACDAGLAVTPEDPHLLGIREFSRSALGELSDLAGTRKLYSIPDFLHAPLDGLPADIPKQLLTGFAVHLFKMHVSGGKLDRAAAFLDALPVGLDDSRVGEARELLAARMKLRPRSGPAGRGLKISIWAGGGWEQWTPRSLEEGGIGGSETAAVHAACELARRGNDVVVYSDCPSEEVHDGVRYVPCGDVTEGRCLPRGDVAVVSRQPHMVDHFTDFKKKVLWVHDVHVGEPNAALRGFLERYDLVLALSEWHKGHLGLVYPFLPRGKIYVTRNGIDASRFAAEPVKEGNRLVYSSSWDRGLETALELLPAIREEVPDAVLDVFYGSKLWRNLRPDQAAEIDALEGALRAAEAEGCVRDHGRVGQRKLAEAFLAAKVWFYPTTWFEETSCISAMEAQAAGCVPVTSSLGALPETVKHGALVEPPCGSFKAKAAFVRHAVNLLKNEGERSRIAKLGREHALANLRWAGVAADWEDLFLRTLGEDRPGAPPASPAAPVPAAAAGARIQVLPPRHRVAVIMGRLSSSVHGIYDVDTLYDEGMMTGTGSSFFNIAWGLAERGHVVDVFCQAKKRYVAAPKLAGANVYDIDEPGLEIDATYDAYISINEPDMLRGVPARAPRICAMWLNDWSYAAQGFDDFVDMYACPSWTHARYIHETTRIAREKLTVINLAHNPEFFAGPLAKRPGSVAWCSSPDRGLHHLLDFWPEVRRRAPGAELKIYYRFKPWFDFMTTDEDQKKTTWGLRAIEIGRQLDALGRGGENGVHLVDSVPPRTMAMELCRTVVLAYPCDPTRFTEGFSCSIMDACAAGCVPIISPVDALPEIYGGVARMVPGPPGDRRAEWVDAIAAALEDRELASSVGGAARAFAARHTRQVMAAEWERLVDRLRR